MATDPTKKDQCARILRHLQTGATLTPLEALNLFGCNRLAARCFDLKRAGHEIRTEMVKVGQGKRVARYRLAPTEIGEQMTLLEVA